MYVEIFQKRFVKTNKIASTELHQKFFFGSKNESESGQLNQKAARTVNNEGV